MSAGEKRLPNRAYDYERIARAIEYLDRHRGRHPRLRELAQVVHLSEFHFQRLFKRWAGISPKRFLQFLTVEHAKRLLDESRNLLEVSERTGLSSPSRLHDLFVSIEAITPGQYREKGRGLTISYGVHRTPFGECLLAATERGICRLKFMDGSSLRREIQQLKRDWPDARIVEDREVTGKYVQRIFSGRGKKRNSPLKVILKGTNFQVKVWEALVRIPEGTAVSYEDLALSLHRPRSTRAVASAVAKNPVLFLIPCHRVIRKMGVFGNYRGGATRKKVILAWEAARRTTPDARTMNFQNSPVMD